MSGASSRKNRRREAEQTLLQLAPSLRIGDAAGLRERLTDALAAGHAVCLDGSAVESIDTAGLQLLTAFMREGRRRNVAIDWSRPHTTLIHDAALLGLSDALGLPHPTGAASATPSITTTAGNGD